MYQAVKKSHITFGIGLMQYDMDHQQKTISFYEIDIWITSFNNLAEYEMSLTFWAPK